MSTAILYSDEQAVEKNGPAPVLTGRVNTASQSKDRLSFGVTFLLSFVTSAAATLFVCVMAPVPPPSLMVGNCSSF